MDVEIHDVVANLVIGHGGLIGEAPVLVGVDPHVVGGGIPEDREEAARSAWVAVAVDVGTDLAAQARVAFVEDAEPVATPGGSGIGHRVYHKRRSADLGLHGDPGGVVVPDRCCEGHPVYHLPLP